MVMQEEKPKRWWQIEPTTWGWLITFGIVGCFLWLFFRHTCRPSMIIEAEVCEPKWRYLLQAPPNEIGDTVAGIAGSLAFVWIVIAVFLQSRELGAQREELAMTRDELKGIKEAQQLQLGVLQSQADIFRDEQRQRTESRAEQYLNQLLVTLMNNLVRASSIKWGVAVESRAGRLGEDTVERVRDEVAVRFAELPKSEEDLKYLLHGFYDQMQFIRQKFEEGKLKARPAIDEKPDYLTDNFRQIEELEEELSEGQSQRLTNINFDLGLSAIEILMLPELWADNDGPPEGAGA
jgi:hypothetical protein